MNEFTNWLRSIGLIPKTVTDDGRWRRVGTETHPRSTNGAYKLLPGGRIGFAQDWASDDKPHVWRAGREAALPALDLDAMRRAQADHEAAVQRAIQKARDFYGSCAPLRGGHPYLESHGLDVTGCEGLRVDREGWLVVPAWRGRDALTSVQRIAPDGEKRFWPGAPVSATRYTIRKNYASEVTIACEGLATGLACVAALKSEGHSARAVVAWNAGNLQRLELGPVQGWLVIAADNDHATEARIGKNPGVEAANHAAARLGAGVAFPSGITGTDWCDYQMERRAWREERKGPHESREQIKRSVSGEIARELMRKAVFVSGQRAG